jgi:Spy/CpxP family protein refolding chaperone
MFSRIAIVLIAVLVTIPAASQAQERTRYKWWQDAQTKQAIGLTDEQSVQVEAFFQESLPKLQALKKTIDALEAQLSTMIRERRADESTVAAKIDEVEDARCEANKTRTLMLYRMHRVLSPEQDLKLKELHDKREQERRGRGGERRRP